MAETSPIPSPDVTSTADSSISDDGFKFEFPSEILRKIFSYFTNHPDHILTLPSSLAYYDPWTFRSVSAAWRKTALEFSELWSHASISQPADYTPDNPKEADDFMDRIRLQVEGIMPIDRPLSFDIIDGSEESPYARLLTEWILQSYGQRLKGLTLQFEFSGFTTFFLNSKPDSLQTLERLHLNCTEYAEPIRKRVAILKPKMKQANTFEQMPRLRDLTLRGAPFIFEVVSGNRTVWSQLTRLTIDDREHGHFLRKPKDLLTILSHCRNLVHWDIDLMYSTDETLDPPPKYPPESFIVELPRLKTLTFCATSNYRILQHLRLPQLAELRFERWVESPGPAITALLERSSCPLEILEEGTLDVDNLRWSSYVVDPFEDGEFLSTDDLKAISHAAPELKKLMTSSRLDEEQLNELAHARIFPELQRLICRTALQPLEFSSIFFPQDDLEGRKGLRYIRGELESRPDSSEAELDKEIERVFSAHRAEIVFSIPEYLDIPEEPEDVTSDGEDPLDDTNVEKE
jgi:hypothetical protein